MELGTYFFIPIRILSMITLIALFLVQLVGVAQSGFLFYKDYHHTHNASDPDGDEEQLNEMRYRVWLGGSLCLTLFLHLFPTLVAIFGTGMLKKKLILPFLVFTSIAFFQYLLAGLFAMSLSLLKLGMISLILVAVVALFFHINLALYNRLKEHEKLADIPVPVPMVITAPPAPPAPPVPQTQIAPSATPTHSSPATSTMDSKSPAPATVQVPITPMDAPKLPRSEK